MQFEILYFVFLREVIVKKKLSKMELTYSSLFADLDANPGKYCMMESIRAHNGLGRMPSISNPWNSCPTTTVPFFACVIAINSRFFL